MENKCVWEVSSDHKACDQESGCYEQEMQFGRRWRGEPWNIKLELRMNSFLKINYIFVKMKIGNM